MARTGRPKLQEEVTRWEVRIPKAVAAEVELLLLDPVTGDVTYGKRNQLITQLLNQWLDNQRRNVLTSN